MEKYIDRSGLSERDGKGEYADAVFLVTSGEYMALYAANNILRGIHNFDGDVHRRAAGIIYNERKLPDEDGRVSRFAQAVRLPVCGKVPRSHGFAQAEEAHVTLMEFVTAGDCEFPRGFADRRSSEETGRHGAERPALCDTGIPRIFSGL